MFEYCLTGLSRTGDYAQPICLSVEVEYRLATIFDVQRLEEDLRKSFDVSAVSIGSFQLIRKIPRWELWLRKRKLDITKTIKETQKNDNHN